MAFYLGNGRSNCAIAPRQSTGGKNPADEVELARAHCSYLVAMTNPRDVLYHRVELQNDGMVHIELAFKPDNPLPKGHPDHALGDLAMNLFLADLKALQSKWPENGPNPVEDPLKTMAEDLRKRAEALEKGSLKDVVTTDRGRSFQRGPLLQSAPQQKRSSSDRRSQSANNAKPKRDDSKTRRLDPSTPPKVTSTDGKYEIQLADGTTLSFAELDISSRGVYPPKVKIAQAEGTGDEAFKYLKAAFVEFCQQMKLLDVLSKRLNASVSIHTQQGDKAFDHNTVSHSPLTLAELEAYEIQWKKLHSYLKEMPAKTKAAGYLGRVADPWAHVFNNHLVGHAHWVNAQQGDGPKAYPTQSKTPWKDVAAKRSAKKEKKPSSLAPSAAPVEEFRPHSPAEPPVLTCKFCHNLPSDCTCD